jgi:hypothetical protein
VYVLRNAGLTFDAFDRDCADPPPRIDRIEEDPRRAAASAGVARGRGRRARRGLPLACLMIGWMLTSITAAQWMAFATGLTVATAIFLIATQALRILALTGQPQTMWFDSFQVEFGSLGKSTT